MKTKILLLGFLVTSLLGHSQVTELSKLDINGGNLTFKPSTGPSPFFTNSIYFFGREKREYRISYGKFPAYGNERLFLGSDASASILISKETLDLNGKTYFSGRVGIGTRNPQNKLSVNGTIWAQEVTVSLEDGADWVFYEDYKLPPLSEVEAFIKKNKHLPEIPSAEEFRLNDMKVSEMTNKLLQKIEELTLYAIDQNKKLKQQEELLKEQQQELNAIKCRLSKS